MNSRIRVGRQLQRKCTQREAPSVEGAVKAKWKERRRLEEWAKDGECGRKRLFERLHPTGHYAMGAYRGLNETQRDGWSYRKTKKN